MRTKFPRQALLMATTQPTFMTAAALSSTRCFSDSIGDGAKRLGKALEKEIKYENDNYT